MNSLVLDVKNVDEEDAVIINRFNKDNIDVIIAYEKYGYIKTSLCKKTIETISNVLKKHYDESIFDYPAITDNETSIFFKKNISEGLVFSISLKYNGDVAIILRNETCIALHNIYKNFLNP